MRCLSICALSLCVACAAPQPEPYTPIFTDQALVEINRELSSQAGPELRAKLDGMRMDGRDTATGAPVWFEVCGEQFDVVLIASGGLYLDLGHETDVLKLLRMFRAMGFEILVLRNTDGSRVYRGQSIDAGLLVYKAFPNPSSLEATGLCAAPAE